MERRTINPWHWQDALGYAQAVEVSHARHTLHCAGQAAMSADGRPQHAGDMGAQLALALDNLEAVLRHAGYALGDVVRLDYYTTDVDACFAQYLAHAAPRLAAAGCRAAATLVGVTRLAFPELLVEVAATAAR